MQRVLIGLAEILKLLSRFPGKKEPASPKKQNKENVSKPIRRSDPPQRGRGRPRKVNKEEEVEVVKEKEKEEVLCQSLTKRDRNIQENKAMVMS